MFFSVGRRVLRCSFLFTLSLNAARRRDGYPRLWRLRWLNWFDNRLFDGARSKDLLVLVVWSVIGVDCLDWVDNYIEVTVGSPLGIVRLEIHCLSLVGLPSMLFPLDLRPTHIRLKLSSLSTLNPKANVNKLRTKCSFSQEKSTYISFWVFKRSRRELISCTHCLISKAVNIGGSRFLRFELNRYLKINNKLDIGKGVVRLTLTGFAYSVTVRCSLTEEKASCFETSAFSESRFSS